MTYDEVEYILAEIITEATGEPRVGRFERTLAKVALKRLRDAGMTLSPGERDPTMVDARGAEHVPAEFAADFNPTTRPQPRAPKEIS